MGTVKHMGTVASVSEYLSCIEKTDTLSLTTLTVSNFTFYRGQANKDWDLSPSLYRQGLFDIESALMAELNHICPFEFANNKFDTLVKMQHFGLPTRLLDMTTNPLVALYFACENENEMASDSIVYIFPNLPVIWSTDPLVELVMDYVFDYFARGVDLDKMLEKSQIKYKDVMYRSMPNDIKSLKYYLTIPAFPVMPAKTNERINAQDGTFFICGMQIEDSVKRNGNIEYNAMAYERIMPEKICQSPQTIIIPSLAKEKILDELDKLGVNERKLFPDLTHQIKYAVKCMKDTSRTILKLAR